MRGEKQGEFIDGEYDEEFEDAADDWKSSVEDDREEQLDADEEGYDRLFMAAMRGLGRENRSSKADTIDESIAKIPSTFLVVSCAITTNFKSREERSWALWICLQSDFPVGIVGLTVDGELIRFESRRASIVTFFFG